MTDKVKQIIETIKQACDVFTAMELPMAERECTLSYEAAMTLVKELERVGQERDALSSILIDMIPVVETYKRERDAYFESMKGLCATCKKAQFCVLPPGQCPDGMWQWRGVKEG